MEWLCNSCSVKNCNRDFLCKTCQCPRPTATRKIKPPAHVQRGKFIDKVVMDLVQKATKRKPISKKAASKTRVKEAIKKKVAQRDISISQKRRETLMEKQFKAKTDQITKLTRELESMRALVFQTSQSDYIQEQLQAIRNIGELMANPSSVCNEESDSPDVNCSSEQTVRVNGSQDPEKDEERPRKYLRRELHPNTCKYCDYSCKSIWSLSSHLSLKHGVKDSFKCPENGCNFATSSKYFLDKHALGEHGVSLNEKAQQVKHKICPKRKITGQVVDKRKTGKKEGKKKMYRPTMVNDADSIDRDVEIVESLLTDSEEESAIDDTDADWVPENCSDQEENDKNDTVSIKKRKSVDNQSEELLHCPHSGCKYSTSDKYYLTRHRKRKHGEKFARKKREVKTPREPRPKKPSAPRKKRIKEKKFSCELCGAKATSMWYINRHMRLHTGEKPFVCEFPGCTYKSYRKFHITRHVINIHSTERPHKCELCDYSAKTRENLRQHNLSRHAPGHFEQCDFCDFRAKLKEGLRSHVRKCHKFVCKDCSWEFSTDTDLGKHLLQHKDDGLHCEYDTCPNVSKDINEYKIHVFTIHGVQVHTRIARRSKSSTAACDICNYQFSNATSLEAHKSYHTSDGGIICHFCGLLCKGMEVLKDHTVTMHGFVIDARPKPVRNYKQKFTCSTCNYELSSRGALETHFQQHRLDGSVKCTKCPHISLKMHDLVQHYLIIHGERLDVSPGKKKKNIFSCDICKFNFPTASKLENHKKKHQEDGSILCGLCKVSMPSMEEMKGHMMLMHGVEMDANQPEDSSSSSSANVCELCNYMFKDEDQLNLHRSCHMPDGSICCTMCPYYSPNIEYLVMHMREIHQVDLQQGKILGAQQRQRPIEAVHPSKRELFKTSQIAQLQSSNSILHGNRDETLNSLAQTLTSDVESYIRPPACVYDTSVSGPNSSTNSFSGFSKTDFADFLQPNLPPQTTISITNNTTKFVINNINNRSAQMMFGRNNKTVNSKFGSQGPVVSVGGRSDPLTQAVSESGLSSSLIASPPKQQVTKALPAVKQTPKAKAHPGLFM